MFSHCLLLKEFNCKDLSSLTDGEGMFRYCYDLLAFNCNNLSNLENGYNMFRCCNFPNFNANLNSLKNARSMFYQNSNITSFSNDLPSLTYGGWMFYQCSNFTSFNGTLPSLTNGWQMFRDCNLNTTSLKNIATTIKDVTNLTNGADNTADVYKILHLGIKSSSPTTEEQGYLNTISNKGWTVYVNGSASSNIWTPTSLTPLDGEEISTPIPFYAKPIPSNEESGEYIDSNGNYYNILGSQFIYGDDLSTYGMFTCEEDAAANMRLIKVER